MSGDLTPDDVRHWDLSVIHQVFETAAKRRDSKHQLGEALGHARTRTNDWHGESGDAFREELDKPRTDVNAAGRESDRVYSAVRNAEMWVSGAKVELGDVDAGAETYGWTVTPGWKIDGGDNNTNWMYDPLVLSEEQQRLQEELDKAHSDAQTADHELATAVRGAVGDVQLDEHGHEVPQAPGPQNASNSVPGPDGHPPYEYHDGQQHPPPTMIPGAKVIPLTDNPPGFPPVGPGAQRDQNWQRYLNGLNADGGSRAYGSPQPRCRSPKPCRTRVYVQSARRGVSRAFPMPGALIRANTVPREEPWTTTQTVVPICITTINARGLTAVGWFVFRSFKPPDATCSSTQVQTNRALILSTTVSTWIR